MTDLSALASTILAARLDGIVPAPVEDWHGTLSVEQAYETQEVVLAETLRRRGGEIIGRKIGCTNQYARDLLGLDGPFHGALLSMTALESPARIARSDYPFIVLEPEFALRLGHDLAPGGSTHTADSVAGAVEAVIPALEIVSSCYEDWTTIGPELLIADNGSSYGWVHGEAVTDWTPEGLDAIEVRLSVDGRPFASGGAGNIDGGPLGVLAWLANRTPLKAGEIVSTGTTTTVHFPEKGETVEANFGPFGRVSVEIA